MDTYCLCTQSGATHYGGVQSWQLSDGFLRISLDDAAASKLGVDREVTIELRLSDQAVHAVTTGIERVLELPQSA